MPTFVKIKSSQNAEITLSFTDICKSCPSRKILVSQNCLLTLFAKISGFTVYNHVNSMSLNIPTYIQHLEGHS